MGNLYSWVVFIHVAGVLVFFFAHGASAAVAFRLRQERDPRRVRALLDLSKGSLSWLMGGSFLVLLASGIAAGFMGQWWGQLWLWLSLGLMILVVVAMTPLARMRLEAVRKALDGDDTNESDEEEAMRLLAAWNPVPIAALGVTVLLVVLWLMMFKPF